MSSTALELTFCRVEEKDREQLISLLSKVLRDGDSLHADKYDFSKWWWKYYAMPHAEAHIFLCKEGEQILGYYHCPVYKGIMNGEAKKFAMVQDVGVSEAARGKGVFRKLADYATAQLLQSDVSFIYTFPNKKSIHTFIKYNGYRKIETFCTYVLPVSTATILASKMSFAGLHKLVGGFFDLLYALRIPKSKKGYSFFCEEKMNVEMVGVFEQFNRNFKNKLTRDFNYLTWRFEQKPHGKTYFFTAVKDNKTVAVLVVSVEDLLGSKAAVILDFASISTEAFAQLIVHLRKHSAKYFTEKIGLFYTSVSASNSKFFQTSGFVKIPERLNPRALHLLGKNVSANESEVMNAANWNFTLSEWDVL